MIKELSYKELEMRVRGVEMALIENEEEWRSLLENAPDIILKADSDGKILFINRTVPGFSVEETIGRSVYEYIPPDYQDMTREAIKQVFKTGDSVSFETIAAGPGGAPSWYSTRLGPVKRGGKIVAVTQISTDISERKQTEKELNKRTYVLNERVKELNCLYGISDLVEKRDTSLDKILDGVVGLIPPAWQYPEITCARIIFEGKEFRTDKYRDSIWKQTSEIFVNGERLGILEVCYLEEKPENIEGPFLAEERLLINSIAGRLGRIIELRQGQEALKKAHDELEMRVEQRTAELMIANEKLNKEIKERKRAEEELRESAERTKLFAYSVSHDLKGPTIGIYGMTKLLQKNYRDILDEKGKRYCDQILKASEQIGALVEQVNVYITGKEAPLNIEPVNLKEILRMVREEFSVQLNLRQISWQEPQYIPEINADRLSILRVLRNLVDNALKYGGDDLTKIIIGHKVSDDQHILSVKDDGVGIKEKDTKGIFQVFMRKKSSKGVEGTGLGLAIVKEIAERHEGEVWARPGSKKGITVYISIPKYLQMS